MRRNAGLAITAIFGLIVIVSGMTLWFAELGSPPIPLKGHAAQATTNARHWAAGIPIFAQRAVTNEVPHDQADRELRDLNAQEAMAAWGFWSLIASCIAVVSAAVGTGFLLWQISLTRIALRESASATTAMNRANEIALDSQRPWVRVNVKFGEVHCDGRYLALPLSVVFTNVGLTVAHDVIIRANLGVVKENNIFKTAVELAGDWIAGPKPHEPSDAIMPNEEREFDCTEYLELSKLIWVGDPEYAQLCLVAMVSYRTRRDGPLCETVRTFAVGLDIPGFPSPGRIYRRFLVADGVYRGSASEQGWVKTT